MCGGGGGGGEGDSQKDVLVVRPCKEVRRRRCLALAESFVPVDVEHVGSGRRRGGLSDAWLYLACWCAKFQGRGGACRVERFIRADATPSR